MRDPGDGFALAGFADAATAEVENQKYHLSLDTQQSNSPGLQRAVILNIPVRIYKPNLDRNLIGIENKNRTIIYQWINLINGKMYVGCSW